MKRIALTLIAILIVAFPLFSQNVEIPDKAFLYALLEEGVDTNGDSLISYAEAEAITNMDLNGSWEMRGNITDMTGIEAFTNLNSLHCSYNQLTSLDISNNSALIDLKCNWNQITSLDVSENTSLVFFECSNNKLSKLNVTNNKKLLQLRCSDNNLTSLDLSKNQSLDSLSVLELIFTHERRYDLHIDLNNLPYLHEVCVWEDFSTDSVRFDTTGSPNTYFTKECVYNNDGIVFIPDTAFLHALLEEGVDNNKDSLISFAEAEAITYMVVHDKGIIDITGIEAFVNLDSLHCDDNQLTRLDVSRNTALTYLVCNRNLLTSLDVSKNTALTKLSCTYTQLTSLDVSNHTSLTELDCFGSDLVNLNSSGCSSLLKLSCYNNQIAILDISGCTSLESLWCEDNQLTSLDVSEQAGLQLIFCGGNLLTDLDISSNPALQWLSISHCDTWGPPTWDTCYANYITSLDISRNTLLENLRIGHLPQLEQVCVWESFDINSIDIDTTGSPNVFFTTECTTGIDKSGLTGLSIYPNPTNNLLTIETDQPDHYSIQVTTLNGQMVFTGEMEGTSHQIDLSSFQKGVYFITIRSEDFVTTREIVKL